MIRLSVAATVISVMVMIVTLAFASGFQQTISDKVFSFWGHIRVHNFEAQRVSIAEETPIIRNDSITNLLKTIPEIKTIQAYATKNAILKTSENIEGVLFKGVEYLPHFFHRLHPLHTLPGLAARQKLCSVALG